MALYQSSVLKKYLASQTNQEVERLLKWTWNSWLSGIESSELKLNRKEETDWMAYFNEQKSKAQALQADITRLDRDIDALVYELYGLTEEEIRIVEWGGGLLMVVYVFSMISNF